MFPDNATWENLERVNPQNPVKPSDDAFALCAGETCAEQPRNVISDSPRVWRTGYTAIATASISEWFLSQKGIGSVDSGIQPHGQCPWPSSQVLSVEGGVQPMSRTSWSQFICWKLLDDLRDTCSLSTFSIPLVTFCLFYCIVLFKRFQAFSP